MLNWLKSLLNTISGAERAVFNYLLGILTNVYTVLHDDDVTITDYAHGLANSISRVSTVFSEFTSDYYFPFVKWAEGRISADEGTIVNDYNRLVKLINQLRSDTSKTITVIQESTGNSLSALIKWIISTILDPLSKDIAGALGWIEKEGAYVFDLLTHLDKLADLLISFLWSGWLALFQKYAKQIVVLVLSNWKSWLPSVMPILEDIITSLFLGVPHGG